MGKNGVGKRTLISGIFDFSQEEGAKAGVGKPITTEFNEYTSNKRKGLKLIDSKGIEMGDHDINKVFNLSKSLIEEKARKGDPIHCIWYCFKSSCLRFEDIEKKTLTLLINQYIDNNLPIIIVITQNYDEEATKIMTDIIKKEFQFLEREIIIMPVIAKNKAFGNQNNKIILEKNGIEELIKVSFEKSKIAIFPALIKSIEEKINQIFAVIRENKKNELKNNLNEIVQKISNEIKEDENIEIIFQNFQILF